MCLCSSFSLVNAMIYFALYTAETYGWLMAVCFGLGLTEGVTVILIPRLTFLIFPRKHIPTAWQVLMVCQSLGVFIGPALILIVRSA